MERKITHIYAYIMLISILLIGGMAIFNENYNVIVRRDNHILQYNNLFEDKTQHGTIHYYGVLPVTDLECKKLMFLTSHADVKVSIWGEKEYIYERSIKKGAICKSPGSGWNSIPLKSWYANKRIDIYITPVYKNGKGEITCYIGDEIAIQKHEMMEALPRVLIGLGIFIVGIVLFGIWLYGKANKRESITSMAQLAVFALFFGLWLIIDSEIYTLFFDYNIEINMLNHVTLMISLIPFTLFIRQHYRNSESIIWYGYCVLSLFIVVLRIVLQGFNILDIKETLWLTHLDIVLFIAIILFSSVKELVLGNISPRMKANIICMTIIAVAIVFDLIQYRIENKTGLWGTFSFLIYIIVMAIGVIKRSQKMWDQAKESEIYRKLAYTDELTETYSRTAYRNDIAHNYIDENGNIIPAVIVMFDLNNLKKCNDEYGHDQGDYYIKTVSGLIRNVFGVEGRCYRIGGDEFCAILPINQKNNIEHMIQVLNKRIEHQNRKKFVVAMSVATGYAFFDPEKDCNFEDTRKRADKHMYENKMKMKMQRA